MSLRNWMYEEYLENWIIFSRFRILRKQFTTAEGYYLSDLYDRLKLVRKGILVKSQGLPQM